MPARAAAGTGPAGSVGEHRVTSTTSRWDWFEKTWPDWLNAMIRASMILSTFMRDFSGPSSGPLAAAVRVTVWREGMNFALGLWLIAAPRALGLRGFNPFWSFVGDGFFLAAHAAYQIIHPPQGREAF